MKKPLQNKSYGNPPSPRVNKKAQGYTPANKGIRKGPNGGLDLSRSWISSGILDPTNLPEPSLPEWKGWKHLGKDKDA